MLKNVDPDRDPDPDRENWIAIQARITIQKKLDRDPDRRPGSSTNNTIQ
jgi:hypothetical protein